MRLPPERRLDLLALVSSPEPLKGLLTSLEEMGFRIDLAEDPQSARLAFFQSGVGEGRLTLDDIGAGEQTWRDVVRAEMMEIETALAR